MPLRFLASVPASLLQRSTQSVMAATVVIALLGGAYALGRSGGNEIRRLTRAPPECRPVPSPATPSPAMAHASRH